MAETLRVGDREIGPGRPTFFVAEEGQANQGNLGVAREMIRVAAWAQADAIEFQLAIADDFYIRAHPGHAIYKAREFTADELRSLFATAQEAGNGFLMNRGYTIVWSGWQGDVAPGGGRMTFSPPIVPDVAGLAREDFIFDHMDNPASAALNYPAADLDPAHAKISVRQREGDPHATPAGLEVRFESPNRCSRTNSR